MAKGSCGEVRNLVIIGRELAYISDEDSTEIKDLSIEISKMLA
ncbi:MAG: four helix bundle protein [Candidatus Peribacteria bacterium]|nr:four helix bundle protein [Candidatus Peribacteria bacterium]